LLGYARRLVGAGEVCHQRDLADDAAGAQRFERGWKICGAETEAVHAGVYFEEHRQLVALPRPLTGLRQHFQLVAVMHHNTEVVLYQQRDFGGRKKTFQQQNSLPVTGIAQSDRRLQFHHRKTFGAFQALGGAQQTVPVSVGFEHGQDARLRRMAEVAAHHAEILFQRGNVDAGVKGTRHF